MSDETENALDDLPRERTTKGSGFTPAPTPAIPDDASGVEGPTQWSQDDYANIGLVGTSAAKLRSSAVAPLVAKARGYRTVSDGNFNDLMDVAGVSAGARRGMRSTMLTSGSVERDGLFMPWFSVPGLIQYRENASDADLAPTTAQFRPSHPRRNPKTGREDKYVFAKGADMIFDIHPSTPVTWVSDADVPVLLAEGMLKGDAALSGWLLANGASYADLADPGYMTSAETAQARLTELMNEVAEDDRLLILRTGSATTLNKDPDTWNRVSFKNREVWLGLDADVESNPMVWKEANKIRERMERNGASEFRLLSPHSIDDDGEDEKAGIDDYLALSGSWARLTNECLTSDFPEAPADDTAGMDEGDTRVAADGVHIEKLTVTKEDGLITGRYWTPAGIRLGGRQMSRETLRMPIQDEIETGRIAEREDPADTQVSLKLSWASGKDIESAVVTGPLSMLSEKPESWSSSQTCSVPASIQELPQWPPRGEDGVKFLSAVKGNRRTEVETMVRWNRMGWVPVAGHNPAFVIGDQIIAETPEAEAQVRVGFDENVLPHFDSFGVGGWQKHRIEPDYSSKAYRAQVVQDLRTIMRLFVTNEPWTAPESAAIVLATGLRSVVPVRPKAPVFIVGPKGGGKSWTAEKIMSFWGKTRASWDGKLPGSANDTAAAIEHAISRAVTWVLDDLAPNVSDQKSKTQISLIEDVVRNDFNGTTRNRMNANMTSRAANLPNAQVIITAENPLTTPSALDRLIPLYIGKGSLNESREVTSTLNRVLDIDGVAPRLTEHLLRFVLHWASKAGGWEAMHSGIREEMANGKEIAVNLLGYWGAEKKDLDRAGDIITHSTAIRIVIRRLIEELMLTAADDGTDEPTANEMSLQEIWDYFSDDRDGILAKVAKVVFQAKLENQETATGPAIIRAVSNMLVAKRACIEGLEDPALPPYRQGENDWAEGSSLLAENMPEAQVNSALGWRVDATGTWQRSGEVIGTFAVINSRPVVVLNPDNAFNLASKEHPALIVAGQKANSTWAAVWDANLTARGIKQRRERGKKQVRWATKHKSTGQRIAGIPIDLDVILNGAEITDEEAAEMP